MGMAPEFLKRVGLWKKKDIETKEGVGEKFLGLLLFKNIDSRLR